jgi:hypothetical protein
LRTAFIFIAILLMPATALAASDIAETLTPRDLGRLAQFQKARADAIEEAREGGDASDIAVLEQILSGEEQPIRGVDITGDYRCRVAKLGSNAKVQLPGLVIYDWFRCRIDEDDIGYRLTKLSGSQRLSGHFIDDSETSLIFYGADHYADEEPGTYGASEERDTVGRLVKVGKGRYRLEQPLPKYESVFDILELERL